MFPYLNIGPIGLPTGPLTFIVGVWLALYAVDRAARRLQQDPELYYGLALMVLMTGFIGARLVFVLLHWSSYDDNLLGIIWPLTSGYQAAGGALIGITTAFFYGRWRGLALWPALDALAPGLIVFLMTASLADFLGGAGYGSLTSLPWGIDLFGVRRHAVQIYEILVGAAALAAWWGVSDPAGPELAPVRRRIRAYKAGRPFLVSVAVYAAGRLFVDAYKETTPLTTGGVHLVQVAALIVVLLALFQLARLSSANPKSTI